MRLIDADEVISISYRLTPFDSDGIQLLNKIEERVNALPTIEIVRCKDCKHRINDADFISGHICLKRRSNGGAFCEDNDFCSYGEMMTEEDE